MADFIDALLAEFSGMPFAAPFSFRRNTTVGIGGDAPLALYPENADRLVSVLSLLRAKGIRYTVLGRGSNVLASDAGFDGVVVNTTRANAVRTRGSVLTAECGAGVEKVLALAKRNGLGGISFLCGIPATIGGAVFMNAGVRSGYIGERVVSAEVFGADGIQTYTAKDCGFSYKHTRFMEEDCAILSVKLRLERVPACVLDAEYAAVKAARAHLPKGKSMGCVFKNPAGCSAGELIDRVGLKGERCGDARISQEHANFIINDGAASSADVEKLIERMRRAVFNETGIELSEEIRHIGEG